MSDIQAVSWPRSAFSWKIVKIVHQDMKKWDNQITYEWAERSPWVRCIIVNTHWDICISKEHRTELNSWQWWYDYRLPWGKVFDSLSEYEDFLASWWSILNACMEACEREAKEEVGVTSKSLRHVHTSWCGTTMRRDLYYFQLTDIKIGTQELDGMEHIEFDRYSKEQVIELCLHWKIHEDRSVATLFRYIHSL